MAGLIRPSTAVQMNREKEVIRHTALAALMLAATASTAYAEVPESWWSIPLPSDMHRAVAKDVQTALVNLNCYKGPVDGIVGRGTERGIKMWQKANGAPQTGIISEPLVQVILNQQTIGCTRR